MANVAIDFGGFSVADYQRKLSEIPGISKKAALRLAESLKKVVRKSNG